MWVISGTFTGNLITRDDSQLLQSKQQGRGCVSEAVGIKKCVDAVCQCKLMISRSLMQAGSLRYMYMYTACFIAIKHAEILLHVWKYPFTHRQAIQDVVGESFLFLLLLLLDVPVRFLQPLTNLLVPSRFITKLLSSLGSVICWVLVYILYSWVAHPGR